MDAPILRCRDLCCRRPLWRQGASCVRGISAAFDAGRFHAICGPDGCGKNLLLHLLGLLEQPDQGEVLFGDTDATRMDVPARDALRQRHFGFLFPVCTLLPSLSVLENIAFSVLKAGGADEERQAALTLAALQFCGLEGEADQPVSALAPDRRAAAAFARAVVHRPLVLIAESPPGDDILVPLARRAVEEFGLTVVWGAAPGSLAAAEADRVLEMRGGELAAAAA